MAIRVRREKSTGEFYIVGGAKPQEMTDMHTALSRVGMLRGGEDNRWLYFSLERMPVAVAVLRLAGLTVEVEE